MDEQVSEHAPADEAKTGRAFVAFPAHWAAMSEEDRSAAIHKMAVGMAKQLWPQLHPDAVDNDKGLEWGTLPPNS